MELSPPLASRRGRGHSSERGQGDLEQQQPLCPPPPSSQQQVSERFWGHQLVKEWIYPPSKTMAPFSIGRISLGAGRRGYILGPHYPQG